MFGVWIGDGPLRAKTERLARKLGLSGRILFTGNRRDVEALLPGMDVFAMASRYEGLPCAIVEAMSAGLPVVATAVNAVPDVVIAGETGLLAPPGMPDLLGRAIGHMLDHPADAARLGAAGRHRLGGELSPDALGAVLTEAYLGRDVGAPPAQSELAMS